MCKSLLVLSTVALAIVSVSSAHGSAITVANHSFESPAGAPASGEYTSSSQSQLTNTFVPGWGIITSNPVGIFTPKGALPNIDGVQAGFIQGSPGNEMYQDVGALQPNTIYTLTVAMAGNLNESLLSQAVGSIQLVNQVGIDGPTSPLSPIVQTSPTQGMTLTDYTTSFTTGPVVANDLAIVLSFAPSAGGNNPQIYYDNVRLTATPEPSSLILCGLGAAGLLIAVRRRRRA